jgi:hypothetical protein
MPLISSGRGKVEKGNMEEQKEHKKNYINIEHHKLENGNTLDVMVTDLKFK